MIQMKRRRLITIQINPETLTRDYLQMMNGVMRLTPRQLEVLEAIISISSPGSNLTASVRRKVRQELGFNGHSALNIIIMELKNKGALRPGKHFLKINPYLVPLEDQLELCFRFAYVRPGSSGNMKDEKDSSL